MKSCQAARLLALVLASSPAMATKCPPENICAKFINQEGGCDAAKCMADCVSEYKGAGEGQCFSKGCRYSYCCKSHQGIA